MHLAGDETPTRIGEEATSAGARPGLRPADLVALVLIATLYVLAAKLGLTLAFVHASATAVWPPAGIALAVLLLRGYRMWPAVFVGAFVANITTAGSKPDRRSACAMDALRRM